MKSREYGVSFGKLGLVGPWEVLNSAAPVTSVQKVPDCRPGVADKAGHGRYDAEDYEESLDHAFLNIAHLSVFRRFFFVLWKLHHSRHQLSSRLLWCVDHDGCGGEVGSQGRGSSETPDPMVADALLRLVSEIHLGLSSTK